MPPETLRLVYEVFVLHHNLELIINLYWTILKKFYITSWIWIRDRCLVNAIEVYSASVFNMLLAVEYSL